MLPLAVTARAFGQRPSALMGIEDPVVAIDFDVAAAAVLWRAEHPEPEPEPVALWGEMGDGREPIRRLRLGIDY